MFPVLLGLAMFLLAFAIPYHAPRLGLFGGGLGMALAVVLMLHGPARPGDPPSTSSPIVDFDFDLDRPIGIALGLYALLWLLISTVQLTRGSHPAR
jgi:hypothetical protein